MEAKDKNGLTEKEFLAAYDPDKYPKPSLTSDIAIFAREGAAFRLLLIRRGGHPYLGCLALPGGFANAGETTRETAARELREETGVSGVELKLLGVYSAPGRDPRGWVVSAAYYAVADASSVRAQAGDDAADAVWFDVSYSTASDTVTLRGGEETIVITAGKETTEPERRLAFDHAEMIADAVRRLAK